MNIFFIILIILGVLFFVSMLVMAFLLDYHDYKAQKDGTKTIDEQLRDNGVTGLTSSGRYITKDGRII